MKPVFNTIEEAESHYNNIQPFRRYLYEQAYSMERIDTLFHIIAADQIIEIVKEFSDIYNDELPEELITAIIHSLKNSCFFSCLHTLVEHLYYESGSTENRLSSLEHKLPNGITSESITLPTDTPESQLLVSLSDIFVLLARGPVL